MPLYPFAGVIVSVSLCCDPLLIVMVDGDVAIAKLAGGAVVPGTVTVRLPVEAACAASPSYCATTVWAPADAKFAV